MSAAVRVDDVRRRFGTTMALDGATFDVPEGSITGLLGPNGAGKTTAFLIVCTLLRPSGGRAEVAGADVVADPRTVRAALGYMPDFFGIYDDLRVAEYLRFFGASYGLRGAALTRRVDDLLELTGLGAWRDAYVETISRGMKQRLCLARALVHEPAVLILDEPAAGLDPQGRALLRHILSHVRERGTTIVISSHVLAELEDVCTHYVVLARGRVVAQGTRDDVLTVGALQVRIEARPEDVARVAEHVRHAGGTCEASPAGIVVARLPATADPAALLAGLVRARVAVRAFTPAARLEDAFLHLTEER